jgi:hypothetical protein
MRHAEVDPVLDAGDLAPVGQPVAAEGGVVQAVVGVGAHQVQRGGLRRGRGLAGEVAEHGDGGVHLDVPVALGWVVEPAVAACRAGPGCRTGADPDALQRQQRAYAELLVTGGHDGVPRVEHIRVDDLGAGYVGERTTGHPGQPHGRRAGTEAGQQQMEVCAFCGGPVEVLARWHEGHGSLRKQEGDGDPIAPPPSVLVAVAVMACKRFARHANHVCGPLPWRYYEAQRKGGDHRRE